jgi:hypothetical protein
MPYQDWGLFVTDAEDEDEGGGLFDLFTPITDLFKASPAPEFAGRAAPVADVADDAPVVTTGAPAVDVPILTTPLGDVSIVGDTALKALKIGAGFVAGYFIFKMVKK